ncbi:hypothetical protein [Mariniblastus fucicola]|uniref:HEAT repeat protein n=1 Tax=Mariniblastus fucicola TaxID=980251 RepID=A0A5B9PF43_9BACT|nr:hypothetical protein [Mariniblastus fucicola]QEG25018.1 hypothetical protein MFFC18_49410 [Mariniblastus fucicola]
MITLKSDLRSEPDLAIAALVHGVVSDLLHAHKYAYAHFPEFVDLAVIATGLGVLQSNLDFVSQSPSFWDTTQWRMIPRPFLDSQGVVYANAIVAWTRDEKTPLWSEGLEPELKRTMLKSLKFLNKTGDSFFQPKTSAKLLDQPQGKWLEMTDSKSLSTQIIAVRHLQNDDTAIAETQAALANKLRSDSEPVLLNAISASEQVVDVGETVVEELRFLTQHRDHVVRAKAMCALTRLGQLDDRTLQTAGEMLGSKMKHVIYAGLSALSSLGSVSDHLIPAINRSFVRSLQVCDYEFVNLFAAAFTKWLDDPKTHVEELLREDSPEYMEIALEAIDNVGEQLVGLG